MIGTGASAIQIVPEMRRTGRRHTSTSTSAPRRGSSRATTGAYGRLERLALRHVPGPAAGSTAPASTGAARPTCPASPWHPKLAAPAAEGWRCDNIDSGIKDPELRAKVTPHFEIGCKRILISNDYYPALAADNVDLVTDPIAKVTGNAIVTADGAEREIDVLVVATGFYTTELPITEHITGRDGRTLADALARDAAWRRTRARRSRASPTCS